MSRIATSLNRKFLAGTAAGLVSMSLVFLLLFVAMYRNQLELERSQTAQELNRLLQTSLENAMLKRDLAGLREIVKRLGEQPGIAAVMIVNPDDEVRFSDRPEMLGFRFSGEGTPASADAPVTAFGVFEGGGEVLRSINPVRNKPPCTSCHGPVESNPVNGILVVDYDAAPLRHEARRTTLMLMQAGAVVVLVALVGGWWFMRRFVLGPVGRLTAASRALSGGDLDSRVDPSGSDELGELARSFNDMASSLQQGLRELGEKEVFLQALIDADPDGIRVIGDDYRVIRANRSYRAQLGMEEESTATRYCYAESHGRDDPCPYTTVTCPLHEMQRTSEPIKSIHRHVRADGTEFWVEVYAAPMTVDIDGERRTYVVESIRDLKEAVQLSHTQKLSALAELAAGVAHDIHNPLAAVRMALQSNMRELDSKHANLDRLRRYLTLVDEQIDRCVAVTRKLLKLGVFPSETPNLVAINAVVEDTTSLLGYEAKNGNIDVQMHTADGDPRIIAADSEIRLLVLNLLQNAFHAMPDGGRLDVATHVAGGFVKIVIKDTGEGIPPEHLKRIFEPFFSYRADGVEGTGLGLTIARTIAERYHGSIEVESPPGQGATFTVVFPDADERTSAA